MATSKGNVTFSGNNVISDQMSNRTGNLSQTLFRKNESKVKPVSSVLERTNPYDWNKETEDPDHHKAMQEGIFNTFMDQARMSVYYQNNPWGILKNSRKYGYKGPTLGGVIRGNQPPGYLPGNTIEPKIEKFENVSGASIQWN